MKKDPNFKVISNEIKRQFELQMKIDDSHDTKIGIMLGFIIIVLAQIVLNNPFLNSILLDKYSLIFFSLGIICIIYAGYSGIRAYFIRKYNIGPKISELVKQYKNGENRDYNKVISRKIYDAFVDNSTTTQNKSKYIKKMFISFFVGFVFIVISSIIRMVIEYGR